MNFGEGGGVGAFEAPFGEVAGAEVEARAEGIEESLGDQAYYLGKDFKFLKK